MQLAPSHRSQQQAGRRFNKKEDQRKMTAGPERTMHSLKTQKGQTMERQNKF